jgi:glycosyltransferase involved in cell wall biosynthesis
MKLSVAMVAYNQERFVAQALESVLAQRTKFDFEVVIGDDGSTDGTRAAIESFQRRRPDRIFPIFRERNIGAGPNFVATLGACRGEYVAFLEGDDYWTSEDKLQRQVDVLDGRPDRVLCCHRVRILNETAASGPDVLPARAAGVYAIEDLLEENFVMTSSTVLRRDLIGTLPPWYSAATVGDWPLFALVARHGKIELLDDAMTAYRVHAGGAWSSRPMIERLREGNRMLRLLDEHLEFRYAPTIRRTILRSYLTMAATARSLGRRAETAEHLSRYAREGGLRLPENRRLVAGLAAYVLIGSGYRILARARTR